MNPVFKKINEVKEIEKIKMKPRGYWKDFYKLKKVLKPIIDMEIRDKRKSIIKEAGEFPTADHLSFINRYDIITAISRYHGGFEAVRVKMGYDLNRKPMGYWKNFNNVKKEIHSIIDMEITDDEGNVIKEAGVFPKEQLLRKMRRYDILRGIAKYHGGLEAVRVKMGYELDRKPIGYWEDFNNIKRELQPIIDLEIIDGEGNLIKPSGIFPTRDHIRYINRTDLDTGISKYHGGLEVVREKMGYEGIDMSSRGRYIHRRGVKSEKTIIKILEDFCKLFGFPYKSGESQVGPHHLLEFQCGKDRVVGTDVTNTDTEWVVERKWKEKEYQKYVDILWIIVLSTKWDEAQYDIWNRESPDNVYVIDGRYLEEFLNSLVFKESERSKFKITQSKKKLIDILAKCTFYNKEKVLKEYKDYMEYKKQKVLDKFLKKG